MQKKSQRKYTNSRKARFKVNRLKKIKTTILSSQGYIGLIILLMVVLGVVMAGGASTFKNTQTPLVGTVVDISPSPGTKNLQLQTLTIVTITPTVPPVTVQPALCTNKQVNDEPGIIWGYSPGQGQTAGTGGQIKVWVSDENPPCVGTGETINADGSIATRGNTTEAAPDGYLWEPALYIAPSLAENGGVPHFADFIKGTFNNSAKSGGACDNTINKLTGPAMDPIPPGFPAPNEPDFQDEYIWNVSGIPGLTPGNSYQGEFVIHDGDDNRGVGCVNISI